MSAVSICTLAAAMPEESEPSCCRSGPSPRSAMAMIAAAAFAGSPSWLPDLVEQWLDRLPGVG